MLLKTSFFSPALVRKNYARFWPIWGTYLVVWLFLVPVVMGVQLTQEGFSYDGYLRTRFVLEMARGGGPAMAAIFGLFSALAVFSYMYSSRSANAIHSLPIRREGLFLSNYLSGLSWLVGSNAAVFLVTVLVELANGGVNIGPLLQWLALTSLNCLFFYSFAALMAHITGNGFAMVGLYIIMNFIVYLVETVVRYVSVIFCYGLAVGSTTTLDAFSPLVYLLEQSVVREETRYVYGGWSAALIYGLVGLVFAAAALLTYRRRRSESAGDVISAPTVRPVFKYCFSAVVALILGWLFYLIFFQGAGKTADGSVVPLLICMLIAGAVGYFIAEMLLKKSFKVFKKRAFSGLAVFLVAIALFMGALEVDLFGAEKYTPATKDIASVSVNVTGNTLTVDDPQIIEDVKAAHARIVSHKSEHEDEAGGDWSYTVSVRFTYNLNNGHRVNRRYTLRYSAGSVGEADLRALENALNTPAATADRLSWVNSLKADEIKSCSLYLDKGENMVFEGAELVELVAAIQADLAEGTLGRVSLLKSDSYSYLACTFNFDVLALLAPGSWSYNSFSLRPDAGATHIAAFLKARGIEAGETVGYSWYSGDPNLVIYPQTGIER